MDELDFYNPELDDLELIENKPRKRRRKKNPEPAIAVATPILLLGLGYVAWCWYNQTKTGLWNWQPWKLSGLIKPRLRLRQNTNNEEAARRQAEFDKALEHALKPSVITVDTEIPWRPVYGDTEKERVSFIVP